MEDKVPSSGTGANGTQPNRKAALSAFPESRIYQRIGEFVVSFQWIENRIREIGWFIQHPDRKVWPPAGLRSECSHGLFFKIRTLFLDVLPRCSLGPELEADFRIAIERATALFEEVRLDRNRILHSAFIEMKAGGEITGIMRSDPKFDRDPETGEVLFAHEVLSEKSFDSEMKSMGELSLILNRFYTQLIARLPHEHD